VLPASPGAPLSAGEPDDVDPEDPPEDEPDVEPDDPELDEPPEALPDEPPDDDVPGPDDVPQFPLSDDVPHPPAQSPRVNHAAAAIREIRVSPINRPLDGKHVQGGDRRNSSAPCFARGERTLQRFERQLAGVRGRPPHSAKGRDRLYKSRALLRLPGQVSEPRQVRTLTRSP
jgi:hypothetical protein